MRPAGSSLPKTVGLLAISAAVHIVAFAALPSRIGVPQRPPDLAAIDSWEVALSTPPPAPEQPEAPGVPAAAPPAAVPRSEPRPRPRATDPAPTPAAPEPEPLHGRTLTSDQSDSTWSSDVGDGAELRGPAPALMPPAPALVQPQPTVQAGPSFVPLASLSRKPQAPGGLDGLLRRFYPRRARSQGIEGAVTVRMRVLPDGRLGDIRVLDERPAGFDFAGACRQMLQSAPPFVPPLDRAGKRVATDVAFRCTFEIDH